MKHIKLYIIIIFIAVVLVCGCTDLSAYVPVEKYDNRVLELEEANNIIDDKDVEIKGLKKELNTLENDLDLNEEETEKYKYLLANLNNLLSNVYYGYAENKDWVSGDFTAFSIKYKGEYYLIATGHCAHYKDDKIDTGVYTYFKFKANFSDEFIYPKLLVYDIDYLNRSDYAVLYSDKIDDGFIIDDDNDLPKYILGSNKLNKNIIKTFNDKTLSGESGAPIVDYTGELIGMNITDIHSYYVKIDTILEAIENLGQP